MEIETTVLETDEDAIESVRNMVTLGKAPLPVPGRPGPEEAAFRAEKDGRNRVSEKLAGQREPEDEAKGKGRPSAEEQNPPPSPPRLYWTISSHCPFVLAWTDAAYMASTATPGW